jgi:hypothetical protein
MQKFQVSKHELQEVANMERDKRMIIGIRKGLETK